MKKIVLTLAAGMILAWPVLGLASVSSVDSLIQKLEDKGILTAQDAVQIKGEIASDQKASQEATFKSLLPDWVSGLKVSGDFRLRDQDQVRKTVGAGGSSAHLTDNRVRIRARLNFEDQINDKVKLVVGIATNGENANGVGNPRSNNITLGGNNSVLNNITKSTGSTTIAYQEGTFSKPTVVLNKAYAVYTPAPWATLMGGKMDNPVWEPASTPLLWDPDITPEGGAIKLEHRLNDYVTPFSTNAIFILKDLTPSIGTSISSGYGINTNGVKTDPYMFVTQEGIKGNLTEKVYYKAAGSYYNVNNPNHFPLDYSSSGNTMSSTTGLTGTYSYNYNLVGGGVDFGMNDPFGELLPSPLYIPQIGFMGEYYRNVDPAHQNSAWMMGAYMGSSAINGLGTWKIQSYYKVLEADSWLAALPDDDFYSGNTNTQGLRTQLDLGLAKNLWFTMSYFKTSIFKHATGSTLSAPEDLFQMDLNFKF
ncbi:MAG: putative porin [Candidatus Omnitrophica bacterium]|nr:putative porin [Candidatus Omnitrophota bacterium]